MAVRAWKRGCEGKSMVEVKEEEDRGTERGQEGQAAWRHDLASRDGYV